MVVQELVMTAGIVVKVRVTTMSKQDDTDSNDGSVVVIVTIVAGK